MDLESIAKNLPVLFAALLVAILFIQSGLDKVLDRKGNLEWLTGHFSKTFLSPTVPMTFAILTVMELVTGAVAAAGIIYFLVSGSTRVIFFGSVAAALTLIALFFGQRIAKDYPGAAVLVPYFLLVLAMMYLSNSLVRA